jgi:hypothetical protein
MDRVTGDIYCLNPDWATDPTNRLVVKYTYTGKTFEGLGMGYLATYTGPTLMCPMPANFMGRTSYFHQRYALEVTADAICALDTSGRLVFFDKSGALLANSDKLSASYPTREENSLFLPSGASPLVTLALSTVNAAHL